MKFDLTLVSLAGWVLIRIRHIALDEISIARATVGSMFMASGEDFMKKTQQLAWPCWPFFTAILHGPSRAATYRLAWSVSRFAMARKERREATCSREQTTFSFGKGATA
jgi:hypothetical protein